VTNWKLSLALCFTAFLSFSGLFMACAQKTEPAAEDETVEGESDLSAEASFKMDSASDCVSSFSSRPFLSLVASRRGWGSNEITVFCNKLETIKQSYASSTTLTVATVAGFGQINGSDIENALYIGAVGYDLTALRNWVQASVGVSNFPHIVPPNFLNTVPLDFHDCVPVDFLDVVPRYLES